MVPFGWTNLNNWSSSNLLASIINALRGRFAFSKSNIASIKTALLSLFFSAAKDPRNVERCLCNTSSKFDEIVSLRNFLRSFICSGVIVIVIVVIVVINAINWFYKIAYYIFFFKTINNNK